MMVCHLFYFSPLFCTNVESTFLFSSGKILDNFAVWKKLGRMGKTFFFFPNFFHREKRRRHEDLSHFSTTSTPLMTMTINLENKNKGRSSNIFSVFPIFFFSDAILCRPEKKMPSFMKTMIVFIKNRKTKTKIIIGKRNRKKQEIKENSSRSF